MTMTLEDRAKLAVHELQAWPQRLDAQKAYVLDMLRLAVADEREACALLLDTEAGIAHDDWNDRNLARQLSKMAEEIRSRRSDSDTTRRNLPA